MKRAPASGARTGCGSCVPAHSPPRTACHHNNIGPSHPTVAPWSGFTRLDGPERIKTGIFGTLNASPMYTTHWTQGLRSPAVKLSTWGPLRLRDLTDLATI